MAPEAASAAADNVITDRVTTSEQQQQQNYKPPSSRKTSWSRLRRVDSLHLEAGRVLNPNKSSHHSSASGHESWERTLRLAFQSIGVVYGDIGTSPLYTFPSTFPNGIGHNDDILGVLSLVIYTLILFPLLKYVFIVLRANDNGDGGTFALYSKICRYARVSLIPNHQAEDAMVSNYNLDTPSREMKRAQWVRSKLEGSRIAKDVLFFVTILGTSMVIGDGILTPCISVLSAVSGIKEKAPDLSTGAVDGISVAILILLFAIQRFGTDKVGYAFAPMVAVWFAFISCIGVYNLFKHDVGVLKAFNPKYIYDYFYRNGKQAWISLGGVVLSITGTEAMFADLGHFNVRAIQIGYTAIVFPSVLLSYFGQAAYLHKNPDQVSDSFYKSVPTSVFWPMFIVAVLAAIIASQAMISGAFAIISQSQTLGCFPRVRIYHTSKKYEGQVYIPEINYILMIACVIVTLSFRTTEKIGNAYGIAVVSVMFITTSLIALIMLFIWKTRIWWIVAFLVVFGLPELLYLSAVFYKFDQGGYLPLAFSAVLMGIMAVWHYGHVEKYKYELRNKVSGNYIRDLAARQDISRLPGIGLLYSELVQGIPPIFPHFIDKIPCVHSVLVFVSVKFLPVSRVEPGERFLFRQVEPRDYKLFRCVARYGYKDALEEPAEFEALLVESLKGFIREDSFFPVDNSVDVTAGEEALPSVPKTGPRSGKLATAVHTEAQTGEGGLVGTSSNNSSSDRIVVASNAVAVGGGGEEEAQFLQKQLEKGVVYLLGETEVVAHRDASVVKKVVINYLYNFMRRNFRQGEKIVLIPRRRLLRVGMTYEVL